MFVYKEGLARFATIKYSKPMTSNLDNPFMHLTNYAINKKNPEYVFNKGGEKSAYVGHKRTISSIF